MINPKDWVRWRHERVLVRRAQGYSYAACAREVGMSRERVRQIVAKHERYSRKFLKPDWDYAVVPGCPVYERRDKA